MRMSQEMYSELETAIQNVLVNNRATLAGVWDRYSFRGLSHERMRWDLFWATKPGNKFYAAGLSDCHIDTALRRITHAPDCET